MYKLLDYLKSINIGSLGMLLVAFWGGFTFYDIELTKHVALITTNIIIAAYFIIQSKKENIKSPWPIIYLIPLIPILASFPGIFFKSTSHFFFYTKIEFSSALALATWVHMSYLCIKKNKGITYFSNIVPLVVLPLLYMALKETFVDHAGDPQYRPMITFGNANLYSGFICATLMFTIGEFVRKFEKDQDVFANLKPKLFWLGMIAMNLVALVNARGRTATVTGLIGAGLIFLLNIKKFNNKNRKFILYSILSLSGVIFLFEVFNNFEMTKRFAKSFEIGLGIRKQIWQISLASIKENILFGSGAGSFVHQWFEHMLPDFRAFHTVRNAFHAHNDVLEIGIESGLTGIFTHFLLWGSILFFTLKEIIKQKDDSLRLNLSIAFVLITCYHLNGILSINSRFIPAKFMLYFAVAYLIYYFFDEKKNYFPKFQKLFVIVPVVVSLNVLALYGPAYSNTKIQAAAKVNIRSKEAKEIEKIFIDNGNVVGLFLLVAKKYQIKDYDYLDLLDAIENNVPHYQTIDFLRALNNFKRKNYEGAIKHASAFLKRDTYNYANNILLMRIAAMINNKALFLKHLKVITIRTAMHARFELSKPHKPMKITMSNSKYVLFCDNNKPTLECNWNTGFVTLFFDILRSNDLKERGKDYVQKLKVSFYNHLSFFPVLFDDKNPKHKKAKADFLANRKNPSKLKEIYKNNPDINFMQVRKRVRFFNKTFHAIDQAIRM